MIQSSLLQNFTGFINGKWAEACSSDNFPVRNPATREHLADVPDLGKTHALQAVESAERALRRQHSIDERVDWLNRIHASLLSNKEELARIITLEQGKPLKESVAEVEYAAGFFKYYAECAKTLEPEEYPEPIRGNRWQVRRQPAGVVGLITPWNFPLAMLAKKFAPAIAAGCAVVTKPADLTPLTAIALWHLLDSLRLPEGRFNLVLGQPGPIGNVLCSHPAVRLISFTGSTAVGRLLIQQTGPYVKRLALELGGNAPFIVMEDADVQAAVTSLMLNKFRCAGQTCVCSNRVLVHQDIIKPFTDAVAQRVAELKVGNGLDPATEIGPLINASGVDKVNRHVTDAISRGARNVAEARVDNHFAAAGSFRAPVVLGDLPPEAVMLAEETFGPVVGIASFRSDAEAVFLANSTIYGLAAYLFTSDPARVERMLPQLTFGHVGINTGAGPTPEAPFGGMKQSGFGREGGVDGLLEFCEAQTVVRA